MKTGTRKKRKVKRKKWHTKSKPTNQTTPSQSKRGAGKYRSGLGAIAIAASSNHPASSQLKKLLSIIDPTPTPSSRPRPETFSPPTPTQDDLSDVRQYLATMNSHVTNMESTLGLPSPNNLRRRPSTSPNRISQSNSVSSLVQQPNSHQPHQQRHHHQQNNYMPHNTGTTQSSTMNTLGTMSPNSIRSMQHGNHSRLRRSSSNQLRPFTTNTSSNLQRDGPASLTRKLQLDRDQNRSLNKASHKKRQRQLSAQRTRTTPKTTINPSNLRVDPITGVPIVTGEELRNDSPTFDSQMNFFVDRYIKKQQRPKGILKVQTWWRSTRHLRKYQKW